MQGYKFVDQCYHIGREASVILSLKRSSCNSRRMFILVLKLSRTNIDIRGSRYLLFVYFSPDKLLEKDRSASSFLSPSSPPPLSLSFSLKTKIISQKICGPGRCRLLSFYRAAWLLVSSYQRAS